MRILVLLLLGTCAAGGLAHADDSKFEKRLAVDSHGVVEISNVAGSLDITAWDNPEVYVRGDLGAGSRQGRCQHRSRPDDDQGDCAESHIPQRFGRPSHPRSARQRVGYLRSQLRSNHHGC